MLIGEPDDLWLVASDSGYGFTVRLKEMHSRNRAGKGVLKVPEGAKVLPASPVPADPNALVAVVGSEGKMLVFPVSEVPELPRGKGNKLFGISSKKFATRDEYVAAMTVIAPDRRLVVLSGERRMTLSISRTSIPTAVSAASAAPCCPGAGARWIDSKSPLRRQSFDGPPQTGPSWSEFTRVGP